MLEPPEKGYYVSTVIEKSLDPDWTDEKAKKNDQSKKLFERVGKEYMLPLEGDTQDSWTFLWKEGEVIHVQIWHKQKGTDDYMGNACFEPEFPFEGLKQVTGEVTHGPPGQIRSDKKVSGTITIAWEWETNTEDLVVEKWIPLLQKLTYGEEKSLPFLGQDDLTPYMPLTVCLYLLGQIALGNVSFPENCKNDYHHKRALATYVDNEMIDEVEEDDMSEPEGNIFLAIGEKVVSTDIVKGDLMLDVRKSLADTLSVDASSIAFYDSKGLGVPDDQPALDLNSEIITVQKIGGDIRVLEEKVCKYKEGPLPPTKVEEDSEHESHSHGRHHRHHHHHHHHHHQKLDSSSEEESPSQIKRGKLAMMKMLGKRDIIPHTVTNEKLETITQLARFLLEENFEKFVIVLSTLPEEELLKVTPIVVSCSEPNVLEFVEKKMEELDAFAMSVRMIQNARPELDHLAPLAKKTKLTKFIQKCLDEEWTFEEKDEVEMKSRHPLTYEKIDKLTVTKIFSSLARPAILTMSRKGEDVLPAVLFKRGEDLYNETCFQIMFRFMNELWDSLLPPQIRPHVFCLREMPISDVRGFMEIIPDTMDLEIVERDDFEQLKEEVFDNFIRTTCGWVLACYFLGISDRHRENTLVRPQDGSAIPIDFGFILGNQPPSYNTFCITISPEMYKFLQRHDKWLDFCIMFLAGFWCVHAHAQEFLRLCVHLLTGTKRDLETSARFVAARLRLEEDSQTALRRTFENLRHAPVCFFTRRKIHGHSNAKKVPQRKDFIGALARKLGTDAAKPEKASIHTGGDVFTRKQLHPGKVVIDLPKEYPDYYPGEFAVCLLGIAVAKKDRGGKQDGKEKPGKKEDKDKVGKKEKKLEKDRKENEVDEKERKE